MDTSAILRIVDDAEEEESVEDWEPKDETKLEPPADSGFASLASEGFKRMLNFK
jgi:hypothetical protein